MHIKIFTKDNYPYGGASANFVRNMARSLALNEDINLEVIIPRGNFFANNKDVPTESKGIAEGVPYKFLGFKSHPTNLPGAALDNLFSNFLPFFFLLSQFFRKKADVIIVYNTSLSWFLQFLFFKWITGKKLIVILPEFYRKPTKSWSAQGLKWKDFYLGLKFLSRKADKIIALTTFMKRFISELGFEEKNILVLPNVTDVSYFKKQNSSPFREGKFTIGYCGTPTYKDGIDDLLAGFAELCKIRSDVHLLIIGDATFGKTLVPELTNKTEQLGIINQVSFTGLVTLNEVAGYLNACQILALTRPAGIFAEAGFPTKLGEYFACGKPVLITAVGDIPYYFINKEHAIIVQPGDIEGISSGFNELIDNKSLADSITENAEKWLLKNLDFQSLSGKLHNFIKS